MMDPILDACQLRVLAGMLAYPEAESYAVLAEWAVTDAPWLSAALPELHIIALDAWQGEHTRLFINGFPKTVCPPFESFWRHGRMDGRAGEQLLQIYRQAGLELSDGSVADYLGTILECSAYCLATTGHSLLEQLTDHHLRLWIPEFATTLAREAELSLYRLLAQQLQHLFGSNSHGGSIPLAVMPA
ncbi:MAG: molecular chaperone TorD family protein [Magnetococcales bacterium]|nr:molecular chaperone TorD family protein [Magnetococcales bacterium]